jgi:hypothetical protein
MQKSNTMLTKMQKYYVDKNAKFQVYISQKINYTIRKIAKTYI